MARLDTSPRFTDYLTVSQAAEFLGVSTATLRNWDRSGKLTTRRHPQNGYRIYLHEDLEAVLRSADLSALTDGSFAPQVDWAEMRDCEHFVQFYENDEYLIESISGFVGTALKDGNSSVIIGTAEHRNAIHRKLIACGVDEAGAINAGRYVVLDASETLSQFMVNGFPAPDRFSATVGSVIGRLAEGGRRVHAFGEMVALLWADGHRAAAIRLEELWNELGQRHRFALFCAYPINGFDGAGDAGPLNGVCSCHSRVIPAESYAGIDSLDDRLRAITLLQQKAQSLEAEIAHRFEVESALSKRERELVDFFENAMEGIHKVGPDGTILWANKAEYGSLGYTAEEYIGHSITEFHADATVIADMMQKLERGEALENFPARLRCKHGTIKHVLISSNAYFEDGRFVHTRCFTRDVTQQWLAENALREADRRKDEFLATLAHELRNPLAPIVNALELLDVGASTSDTANETRDIIKRQVHHLTRLVDDLLDISRITKDKIELRKERLSLATVIRNAVETSRPMIDFAGHTLAILVPVADVFVDADLARLSQVIANLLNNSAKYTEPGGKIVVEAKQDGQYAVVAVRDNGVGISCEDLAHVFDMFRQVDRSLDRSQGGLGIGLTLVRRLVEMHGGTVNARSEGLGKGSEFVVRLPLATVSPHLRKLPAFGTTQPVVSRRILVVDDNRDAGSTLAKFLQLKGHQVQTAHDGTEGVNLVPEFRPQVILMDIGMPKLNGYDATRQIRQLPGGDNIFIVALTGWGQDSDVQNSKDAGCSAHLVKPVDFAALERLLAEACPLSNSGI
jgi:PAS domain S-box-containing protein